MREQAETCLPMETVLTEQHTALRCTIDGIESSCSYAEKVLRLLGYKALIQGLALAPGFGVIQNPTSAPPHGGCHMRP